MCSSGGGEDDRTRWVEVVERGEGGVSRDGDSEQEKVEMFESEGEGSVPSTRRSREKQLGVGGLKAGQQRDNSVATGPVNSSTGTGLD